MSEEAAPKKRGRPRKIVIEDAMEEAVKPVKKTVTRKKAVEAVTAPKTRTRRTKATIIEATEAEDVSLAAGSANKIVDTQVDGSTVPPVATNPIIQEEVVAPAATIPQPTITPITSSILSQLRELEQSKLAQTPEVFHLDARPMSIHPTASLSSPAASKPKTVATSRTRSTASKVTPKAPATASPPSKASTTTVAPSSKVPPASTSAPKPTSQPSTSPRQSTVAPPPPKSAAPPTKSTTSTIPPKAQSTLTAMNSQIVNNISSRAGARPVAQKPLPPNMKKATRGMTWAIIAAPIAIVTSYALWDRLSNQTSKPTLEKSHAEILTSAVDGAENKEVSGNGVASASS